MAANRIRVLLPSARPLNSGRDCSAEKAPLAEHEFVAQAGYSWDGGSRNAFTRQASEKRPIAP